MWTKPLKERYQREHEANFKQEYPSAYAAGHYTMRPYPDVRKSNGLTTAIINYLTWKGYYGNRVNTMGRLIDGKERQESGTVLTVKKWVHSATKKGTADIHCIIRGQHVSIEIKIGADRQSDNQHKEQARIERAGGVYIVVKTISDFFDWLDKF